MKELARLLRFARPYWAALLASTVLMAGVGGGQALVVLLVRTVFDRVLQPDTPDALVVLVNIPVIHRALYLQQIVPSFVHNVWSMVAVAIVEVYLFKGLCDYLGNFLINYAGFSAVTDLRQRVFDCVLHQDAHFFETNSTGGLMSAILNDIDKIQEAVSHMLADWLRQVFTLIALLIVVIQTDWKLALVSLTVLPFVLVPTARLGKRIRRTSRKAQDNTAALNEILQETITGQQVVKTFGTEEFESNRFFAAARKLRNTSLKYVAQQAVASPVIEFFGALTIVGLLTYARSQIKLGAMTTGEFTSFVIALLMLYEPVKRLTGIHNIFEQALGASQKVFEYLDRERGVQDRPSAHRLSKFQHGIRFENVSFHYPGSPEAFVLDGIQLEVKTGEVVALVGPSGAGKTTLANLTPRFYDVTSGAVKIDGRDVRDVKLSSLREKIGIVAQDTFLFNDTVANNIRYGRADATDEAVRDAARNALAEEFILAMPNGYATMIGERGAKLSGGQRQRIAIARALLKNAPILILDEATSQLDTESEVLVQKALQKLMEKRTVIVIAHRLSTIRRADKIVVLDRGKIAEIGTHDDLINQGGIYQRLHEMQFLNLSGRTTPDPVPEKSTAV
ncbi:MAG TPA: ABC transporter ATP-binding protein [Bryobacteraceae bacterium]|jgi:subfamily B ATP-binding cassette protein MsbA|nr:ABC transporter ATP-binding protein [Bryobacteraceae bacterium]